MLGGAELKAGSEGVEEALRCALADMLGLG